MLPFITETHAILRLVLHRLVTAFAGICLLISLPALTLSQQAKATVAVRPDYLNTSLPLERRVDDLVGRLTLEEKVSQMMNKSSAIDRLGIPLYDWWNEALHGVANSGVATVFPQAIGLGATWNTGLMHDVANVISDEARAKYNDAVSRDNHKRFYGLTFWSPNINIFRDPRWGRGQETYGEDPFLTSGMGIAFVRGMQGDDPRYLKTIATPKHFAVHSGPESERHVFNVLPTEHDLWETYLPAFNATITEAGAGSIMCAYNSLNGEPVCASKRMMTDILRRDWGFGGYVVSDCDAVADIYKHHNFAKTEEEAAAIAVRAGTDLTCGYEYRALIPAVKKGLITEAEIDRSVKRLFAARFRLGLFDPPRMVPYSRIPFSANDSAANRAMALRAARESIVLLKNDKGVLPLRKDLKSIAVIGPNADAQDVLLGNYHGIPSRWTTPLSGIRQKLGSSARVTYGMGTTLTGEALMSVPASALSQEDGTPGLRAEYFANKELQGSPAVTRVDPQLNFDWYTDPPAPGLPTDNFSARWTGRITAPATGTYQFGARADDAVRIYVDDKLFIDNWKDGSARTTTKPFEMKSGQVYKLKVEFYDRYADATAKLLWGPPNMAETMREDALRAARESDVVVMTLGLSPSVEGEEMDVKLEGFRGGDRTKLDLPAPQEELLKAVVATGKPIVLVLINGGALSVNWAQQNVPAIVEAWYPGEEGGAALADVLFGDYNPGGRLPVTFYQSAEQLPAFNDYSMQGRTYRYFKGDPLYPFGFGLSYTNFSYSNLKLKKSITTSQAIQVSAQVQNTGPMDGDEVVQLYLTSRSGAVAVPIRSLKAFERVHLRRGEKRQVTFTLSPPDLALINERGQRVIQPGEFSISIGGKQPGFRGDADAKTTSTISGSFVVKGQTAVFP
jgi:beta-glucosidase